jgi:uncharacterized protein
MATADTQAVTPLAPIAPGERITSMDIARGIALLGIFMVNIQLMTQPLSWLLNGDAVQQGPLAAAAHYTTRVLFESKSYPLFSMLFGMGLVLMHDRAKAAGRGFAPVYLRRLTLLLLMGLAHAWLLWYGDILFYYACFGLCIMWLAPLRARTMLIIAVVTAVLAAVWLSGVSMLSALAGQPEPSGLKPSGFAEFSRALFSGKIQSGPLDPAWSMGEADAIGNGPFANAVAMRGINWVSGIVFWVIFSAVFLHVPAMFLLGAAIMRAGILSAPHSPWMKRFLLLGLLIGLPGSTAAVVIGEYGGPNSLLYGLGAGITYLVGPCLSLGYIGIAMWLARTSAAAWFAGFIASAGRMALTNYLLQSLLVAAIAQHWGLARFGTISRVEMVAIVLGIYGFQLVASRLWLSHFSMGPMESLWRCGTYLRLPGRAGARSTAS